MRVREFDRAFFSIVLALVAVFVWGTFFGAWFAQRQPATCAQVAVRGYPVTMCWRDEVVRPDLAES